MVGAILPDLAESLQINYTLSGTLLSLVAVGNLVSNLVYPAAAIPLGHRRAQTLNLLVFAAAIIGLLLAKSYTGAMTALFIAGCCKGCNSQFCNIYVKENSESPARDISFLHAVAAAGCFAAPMVFGFIANAGIRWQIPVGVYAPLLLSAAAVVFCFARGGNAVAATQKEKLTLPKDTQYYLMALVLAAYIGVENCLAGWFFTYLKSAEIISSGTASALVSLMWFMVLAGRLFTTKIVSRVNPRKLLLSYCAPVSLLFLLLPFMRTVIPLTVVIAGIGFGMAGIYPVAMSIGLENVTGNTSAVALMLAVAAVGGIVTPQIVGIVADLAGDISAGMIAVCVSACALGLLAYIEFMRFRPAGETGKGKA